MRKLIFAALMCCLGVAHADWGDVLQARDLNGDGITDAYYSPTQNVTWLQNTDPRATGYVPLTNDYYGGGKYWYTDFGLLNNVDAYRYTATLDIGGTTGWRLSTGTYSYFEIDPGVLQQCNFQPCNLATSEVQTLWNLLGGDPTPFAGLSKDYGTFVLSPDGEYKTIRVGFDGQVGKLGSEGAYPFGAWAVHDGDVGVSVVPEPSTYVLTILGLGVIALVRRRDQQQTQKAAS